MFESQRQLVNAYRAAGIRMGKIQVSSNLQLSLPEKQSSLDRRAALDELSQFAEDKYLHQTCVATEDRLAEFYEDLPDALSSYADSNQRQAWRIHFHMPIYLSSFGALQTGQSAIVDCLSALDLAQPGLQLEIETYAWNVLPAAMQPAVLADGIAAELVWLRNQIAAERAPN
jgi:hypothetical protein